MLPFSSIIKDRLLLHFPHAVIDVIDDSEKHKGHTSSNGGGHYHVTLITDMFEKYTKLARHRSVYALFEKDIPHTIHALRLSLYTPQEYTRKTASKNNGNDSL